MFDLISGPVVLGSQAAQNHTKNHFDRFAQPWGVGWLSWLNTPVETIWKRLEKEDNRESALRQVSFVKDRQ